MTEKNKNYLIECGIGLVIAVVVILFEIDKGHSLAHVLCDGFFVAAVFLLGSGGIMYCRDKGAFDIFGYGMHTTLGLLIPGYALSKRGEKVDYFTYCEQQAEKRKHPHQPILVGSGYLVLSVVCMVIYAAAK